MEGRNLIVKAHGLSQLIFTMQQTKYKQKDIKRAEEIIYKYIWNKKTSAKHGGGRLKRTTLKQSYENGGLNMPDVQNLNDALKLKHIWQNKEGSHPIKTLYEVIYKEKNSHGQNNISGTKTERLYT